jgi:hypothetical protein
MKPLVAPEKRPSVNIATFSPKPWPTIAAVTANISLIPGPPFGPSYRITTTSPSAIPPFEIDSNAESSESKTLALPTNLSDFRPAILTTAPSGARLPNNIFNVPSS